MKLTQSEMITMLAVLDNEIEHHGDEPNYDEEDYQHLLSVWDKLKAAIAD